jgi:PAS domain S-box-containing protein
VNGALLLALGYAFGALVCMILVTQGIAHIDELRLAKEQAHALATSLWREQAAQLEETVARRTEELKEANDRTQTSNQRLALATQAAAVGIWEWDAASSRITWDARLLETYGAAEFHGTPDEWVLKIHPDDRPRARDAFHRLTEGGDRYALDCRIVRPDGSVRHVESRGLVRREPDGRLRGIIGIERDITSQAESAQRIHLLNERLQLALRSSSYGVWELELGTGATTWDDRMLEMYGLRRESFAGKVADWIRHLHPEDVAAAQASVDEVLQGLVSSFDTQFRIIQPNGTVRHIESHGCLQRDADGRPIRLVGLNRDITRESAMQEALHIADQRRQLAIEGTNEAVWDWNFASGTVFHDVQWARLLDYDPTEIDASLDGWRRLVHPEDLAASEAALAEHLAQRAPMYQAEYRMRSKDDTWRWILDRGKVVARAADDRPLRMVGTHTDITAMKNLEQRLRRTDELAEHVSRLAHIGGWEVELETKRVTWSPEVCRLHEVGEEYAPTLDDVRRFFPSGLLDACVSGNTPPIFGTFSHERPLITAKGRHIRVRVIGRADSPTGRPTRIHGAIQDITIQHNSESERRELESRLVQAQKMETLGTLSGGIAHDFNNLLTGIIGYSELAADSVPADHPARACLAEARNASQRASELVEQIIAYSRQSAESGHEPVYLGIVVEEARRFLRATLPGTINVETDIETHGSPILADATQLHQVVLNLGFNAADAMHTLGGTLRLGLRTQELSRVEAARLGGISPGSYLCLSVSGAGHGMDATTPRRIIEPFFSSKSTREGAGLGLAVVHGIVRAHRGAINLENKAGGGTSFLVHLPTSSAAAPVVPTASAIHLGAGELICVVDNEGIVGRYTKSTIEKLGYRAVAFSSANGCLAAWQAQPADYRALVTGQSLTGMRGTELATAMQRLIPGLPVVIMSDYFSKVSSRELESLRSVELLAKPFTTEQVGHALHHVLHPAAH